MKNKILYCIIMICLVSCEDSGLGWTIAKHYVAAYYPISIFNVIPYRADSINVTKDTPFLLQFMGDYGNSVSYPFQKDVYSDYYDNSPYTPTEEQYNKYIELCQKHYDYNYVHEVQHLHFKREDGNGRGYIRGFTYFDITPISIDVFSDKDFDEAHPAGTNLKDIILFTTFSPYPFIKNGYKGVEFVKISKTLDKYTLDDFKLIFCVAEAPIYDCLEKDNYGCIYFLSEPNKEKNHTITVAIKDDYDRTFIDEINLTFK